MDHAEKAKELFLGGYTCAQAVVRAFSEEEWFCNSGLPVETAMKLSSSFGGGMGRLREVCGAVSGMFLLAGLKYGFADPVHNESAAGNTSGSAETATADSHMPGELNHGMLENTQRKNEHYRRIQELAAAFTAQNGSIICRELLGLAAKKMPAGADAPEASPRTDAYYAKRPCPAICACAAGIFEEYCNNHR